MDNDMLNEITEKLIDKRPNTYTYTKALAESLLEKASNDLPVAIVRPSIVTASWREPVPGWIDNINGPSGLLIAVGKGILKTMLCKPNYRADLIPVDVVINLMIVVAWYTAIKNPKNFMIYNCTSGQSNKIIWNDLKINCYQSGTRNPPEQIFRFPRFNFYESRFVNNFHFFFDNIIPAYLLDFVMVLIGRKRL